MNNIDSKKYLHKSKFKRFCKKNLLYNYHSLEEMLVNYYNNIKFITKRKKNINYIITKFNLINTYKK
jgi:hypothetical protein